MEGGPPSASCTGAPPGLLVAHLCHVPTFLSRPTPLWAPGPVCKHLQWAVSRKVTFHISVQFQIGRPGHPALATSWSFIPQNPCLNKTHWTWWHVVVISVLRRQRWEDPWGHVLFSQSSLIGETQANEKLSLRRQYGWLLRKDN